MCEVAEYFESGELVVFDNPDPAPNYADVLESDGTDDSNSDFPEAECAMALLELAQSFGFVSSLNSFSHVSDEPAPKETTTKPSNMHLNNSVEGLPTTASAPQCLSFSGQMHAISKADLRTTPNRFAISSAFDLLSIIRLDHSYETRRPHTPGSISSGSKVSKKSRSTTSLGKLRKMHRQNGKRKSEAVQQKKERETAAAAESGSSPHSDRNIFPPVVRHIKSRSHHLSSMDNSKEPLKIPSKANAVFGIQDQRELFSS